MAAPAAPADAAILRWIPLWVASTVMAWLLHVI
jgi:hypothetical protein